MGRYVCTEHGKTSGPMLCDHLQGEVAGRSVTRRTAVAVRIDMMDDGTMCFGVAICEECARRFGLVSDQLIAGSRLELDRAKHPNVAPSCLACVRERRPDLLDLIGD